MEWHACAHYSNTIAKTQQYLHIVRHCEEKWGEFVREVGWSDNLVKSLSRFTEITSGGSFVNAFSEGVGRL